MRTSFGSGGVTVPRKVDPRPIEAFPVINAHELHRQGLIPPGATHIELRIGTNAPARVEIFHDTKPQYRAGTTQPGFLCPVCRRRVWRLYLKANECCCRFCGRLDHRVRHEHRWCPALHRVRKLRARLASDRPLTNRQRRRMIEQIAVYEAKVFEALTKTVMALERRRRGK
jgi:hypothetical protein